MFFSALTFRIAAAITLTLACTVAAASDQIVTGPERGTYINIGRDLARLVAEPAGVDLGVMSTNGSAENVKRLRFDPSTRLALVQADVYQAYLDEARAGNAEAAQLVRPLRVVLPLFNEEIYFVVRADSPLRSISDIRDQRINIGPLGSGTALSATTLYRQIFGVPLVEKKVTFLQNEQALMRLVTERDIDVVVIVAGQPATLFANMKTQARQYIKLLRLESDDRSTLPALGTYSRAVIQAASYPNWLLEDVPTFSTRSLLVTHSAQALESREVLTRFAESLCDNYERLQAEGHAKWQQVRLALPPLPQGWSYYQPTQQVLARCLSVRARAAAPFAGTTQSPRCTGS
jgi:TRAP transporter TAXI family solute receptor